MRETKLALRHIEGHLVFSSDAAWSFFRLPTVSYEYLAEGEKEALLAQVTNALAPLGGCDCHLVVIPQSYSPRQWGEKLYRRVSDPGPAWPAYVRMQQEHVEGMGFHEREVFLGVCLGRRRSTRQARLAGSLEGAFGVRDERVSEREVETWVRKASPYGRALCSSGLSARALTTAEMAALVRRCFIRGLDDAPAAPSDSVWNGGIEMLGEGTIENRIRFLRLEQPRGSTFLSFLAAARFPDVMTFPGSEWLSLYDALWFPVEASVRFTVVSARKASSDAAKKLAEATDQARHIAGSSAELPLALSESLDRARQLEYTLVKSGAPLVYSYPRFAVWGESEEQLVERVQALTDLYRDHGIDLAQPAGDQLSLFLEALPGERLRVRAYEQRQDLATLAGSMFIASGRLGDSTGCYIGETTGRTRSPVHFDPHHAPAVNRPAAVLVTGQSGAGKTTLAQLLSYQMALKGAWVTVIDPKGEMTRLTELEGIDDARLLTLGPEHGGLLDPFSMGSTPEEAVPIAMGTCQLLLPGRLDYAQNSALLAAISEEAKEDEWTPSLFGVINRLYQTEEPAAHSVAQALAVCSSLPAARLCFAGQERTHVIDPCNSINIIQIHGLRVPDPSTPRDDYTLDQRLGMTVIYLLAQFTLRLYEAGSAAQQKAVVLDEAWMLTATQQGRSLVPALSRMGRSRNAAVLLISQNARDLAGSEVVNNSSAKFAFRATDSDEVEAVLRVLDLTTTPENIHKVRSLGTGECLLRDVEGRVGTVQIDLIRRELLEAFDTTPRSAPEALAS